MAKKEKRRLYSVDCETLPFDGSRKNFEPLVWGVYDGEKQTFWKFARTRELVDFIKENRGIYYAHNGGKFDWFFLMEFVEPNYKIDKRGKLFEDNPNRLLYIAGRLVQFHIGNSVLRDSWSILPVRLASLGPKIDFDYAKLNEFSKYEDEIVEYLRMDCVVLWGAVSNFRETYGDYVTIPSAALAFWRKLEDKKSEEYTTNNTGYDERHRSFYFGGRCQSFAKGVIKGRLRVYDINSAYPYAMLHAHPWGYETVSIPQSEIVPHSFVNLKCCSLGAFPIRAEDGSTDFPADGAVREFKVTGWEYLAARDLGLLQCVSGLTAWKHAETIDFARYVKHFYALKNASKKDSFEYVSAKLFLNSLYGKFGQNWQEFEEYLTASLDCPPVIEVELSDSNGGVIGNQEFLFQNPMSKTVGLYGADKFDGCFFNVAVAASITGFVRAFLLRHLHTAKRPLYCDTDSVTCEDGQFDCGSELGQWKLEGKFSQGMFCGKKLYYLDSENGTSDKQASKGVRISRKDFVAMCKGRVVTYSPGAPSFSTKTGTQKYQQRRVGMK